MTELIIEAGKTEKHYWLDLWRFRELFAFLAWRDVLVRYKQTLFGIAWAVVKPLLSTLIFVVIFGKLAKFPSEGVAYPVMVMAGMLPWQLFSAAVSTSSNSLVGNAPLVAKIYFPRVILPTSSLVVAFIDFLITLVLLAGLMALYQVWPTWRILTLPLFTLLAFAAALGPGLWVSALMVRYRDFRVIVPFIVQFGLYVSPVGMSTRIIPEQWLLLYSCNPMVGVIEGFRWAIYGKEMQIYMPGFLLSVGISVFLLITGFWYFRRTERTFADLI